MGIPMNTNKVFFIGIQMNKYVFHWNSHEQIIFMGIPMKNMTEVQANMPWPTGGSRPMAWLRAPRLTSGCLTVGLVALALGPPPG